MKKGIISLFVAIVLAVGTAAFADKALPVFKAGDTVYVCACGEKCDCKTMSRKAGKCSCNKALGKGVISSVEGDKAIVMLEGKELSFTTKAKYTCACGEGCNCDTISQKPGKCACNKDMKKVE